MSLAAETMGSGPDLVMLHGWGMNASVWSDLAEILAKHYRITLIDLPGHGESPFQDQQALADWAEACLAVAPASAIWLGWSLGSMVAMQAALVSPQSVKGLMVLAGMPRFVVGDDWPHAMPARTFDLFHEALGEDHTKTVDRFLALQMLGSNLAQESLRRLKKQLRQRPSPAPEALEAGLTLLKQTDLRSDLKSLSCPTAWLYGDRDTLAPWGASDLISRWLPKAQIHVISGAAHTPFLSHPDETLHQVERFLEQFDAV
jgi:pimeloyl-[acyl-carrier protein] methyl ester esterase